MNIEAIATLISEGKAVLGIELGSTRIKAVLIGQDHSPIASGDHTWENRLENGIWTYTLEDVWSGVQDAYANLKKDVESKYGVKRSFFRAYPAHPQYITVLSFFPGSSFSLRRQDVWNILRIAAEGPPPGTIHS